MEACELNQTMERCPQVGQLCQSYSIKVNNETGRHFKGCADEEDCVGMRRLCKALEGLSEACLTHCCDEADCNNVAEAGQWSL